jgi:CRISPR-associated protein Csb3
MAKAEIPVDLLNPGQVFACLGLMEVSEALSQRPCEGNFIYEDGDTDARFRLQVDGDDDPVTRVLSFLSKSRVTSIAPKGADLSTTKWGVPTTAGVQT